jgi:inhibitor of Bruton tyrosine kinase
MMCCANAKPTIVEFLLSTAGSNIHQKDIENNFTPIHRAIYYGWIDIAIILKKYGATFGSFDADFSTPLQLIPYSCQYSAETCAYVYGKNKNYNLGIGNLTSRDYPDQLKALPPIKQASINKLYGCGVSKEGRIGNGSEATIVSPQEISIKFNHKHERITMVSAGLHHSLILTHKSVYGCGSNKHFQLGLRNNEKALVFTEIGFDRTEVSVHKIQTVIACDYHSLFVSKQGVFVCGLNVGQFGGIQESIIYPRRLPHPASNQDLEIKWAQSNNCCICTYSSHKEMTFFTIFYNRRVKTYKNPLMEVITQCAISGGEMLYNSDEISKSSSQKPLTVTVMTEFKNLYIWYEDLSQFVKVHVSTLFSTQIREFTTCGDGLLIEAEGQLFKASFQHKVSKMHQIDSDFQEFHSKRDVSQFQCSKMSLKRVPYVTNVNSYCCDVDGESYVVMMNHRNVKVSYFLKTIFL